MNRFLILVVFAGVVAVGSFSALVYSQSGGGSVDIDARVPGCGDAIIDVGEDCDATNLNSKTCATQGFSTGSLSCTASCTFNTSACTMSSSGGGGGGSSKSNKAQVVLSGRAYPKSTVTILKDAQIVATTVADDDARFQVNVSGLSAGDYMFSLYGTDSKSLRSPLLTFPVYVTKGVLVKIANIFVAPTLTTDKFEVRKGDPIAFLGQSTPKSEITLEVNSEEQIFVKTVVDDAGVYLHNFDTSVLEKGQHHVQSRSAFAAMVSSQGQAVPFVVGDKNIPSEVTPSCPTKADLNSDCKVNLVDFSVAAFWFNRQLSESFLLREKEKLNGDGKISIVDFSLIAFYWTG